ncbi:CdaR family transcriptional regulator [Modestobacter sp. Leaf380]|uniref:PucR family transcriptional regulator n=1 Tax=Modestobacter sp. Leaf380 TaxID=1736356 RepID=UPI0006FEE7B8|nr:helix-turn-helix domain-containing protein [Modestobacter sp. Leaf380]KQS66754.1 hypothetical protein ASG41_09985 [Modestobacter sp. Leaf380]
MPLTVADHAAALGAELLVPEGADRVVTSVRLLDGRTGPARDGELLLAVWAPPRRGSALPPLRSLLAPLLGGSPAGVLVLPGGGRVVRPPADAVDLVREAGVALLWVDEDVSPAVVLDRLRTAGTGEGPARLTDALARVLEGEVDVHRVVRRVAELLDARVTLVDSGGREVAQHPTSEDGQPDDGLDVVPVPLVHGGRQLGLWRVERATPLAADELALVDQVTPVLVLGMRVTVAEERAATPVQELLGAVLGEDLAARERAVRRSKRLAAFPARSAVFLVVTPFGVDVATAGLTRLARLLEPAVRMVDERALTVVHEGAVVLVVGDDVGLERLQRSMYRRVTVPLVIGASRAVDDVRGFPGAHRQAQRAAAIGRQLGAVNRVNRYDTLGVHRLLVQLPAHERSAFTRDVLGSVAGDDPAAAEARRVLRAFRATHGNAMEAARQLFLHHNTFRQRLAKLQASIGDFVGDAELRMAVFVALDLHRLDNDREA